MQENKGFTIPARISLGILALAVVAYAVFHVASLFQVEMTTIAAGMTTEYTTVSASGYVFRDETVLYSDNAGVVDYQVRDGEKVSIGQPLAYVCDGDNGEALRRYLRLLDAQIAVLEESTEDAVKHMDISEANRQVSDRYADIVKMLASGDVGGMADAVDGMLVGMNQADVISGRGADSIARTLNELYASRAALLEGKDTLLHTADDSGYFYSLVDGYEASFTVSAAQKLSADTFYSLLTRRADTKVDGKTAYGKLAASSEWNFVIPLSATQAASFEKGKEYDMSFFRSSGLSLPMTLEEIVVSENGSQCLLRFSCDRLPAGFLLNRCEDIRVTVDSVSGMYVPKSATERVDGRLGVYILRGSVVYFRCIEIVYEDEDYYLVRKDATSEEENVLYLRPNDLMILNGHNLFDGRIMD